MNCLHMHNIHVYMYTYMHISVHYTIYNVQCMLYICLHSISSQSIMLLQEALIVHGVHCKLYNVHCTIYKRVIHSVYVHNIHYTIYTMYTVHCTVYTYAYYNKALFVTASYINKA